LRLLLDAHLSGRRVGRQLERRGHDVLALSSDAALAGLSDDEVLAFAARDRRILVTRNSRDFAPLLREWAEGGRSHSGCVLIWTLGAREFGAIVAALDHLFAERPRQADWRDLAIAI
jgi:hypothetical protein